MNRRNEDSPPKKSRKKVVPVSPAAKILTKRAIYRKSRSPARRNRSTQETTLDKTTASVNTTRNKSLNSTKNTSFNSTRMSEFNFTDMSIASSIASNSSNLELNAKSLSESVYERIVSKPGWKKNLHESDVGSQIQDVLGTSSKDTSLPITPDIDVGSQERRRLRKNQVNLGELKKILDAREDVVADDVEEEEEEIAEESDASIEIKGPIRKRKSRRISRSAFSRISSNRNSTASDGSRTSISSKRSSTSSNRTSTVLEELPVPVTKRTRTSRKIRASMFEINESPEKSDDSRKSGSPLVSTTESPIVDQQTKRKKKRGSKVDFSGMSDDDSIFDTETVVDQQNENVVRSPVIKTRQKRNKMPASNIRFSTVDKSPEKTPEKDSSSDISITESPVIRSSQRNKMPASNIRFSTVDKSPEKTPEKDSSSDISITERPVIRSSQRNKMPASKIRFSTVDKSPEKSPEKDSSSDISIIESPIIRSSQRNKMPASNIRFSTVDKSPKKTPEKDPSTDTSIIESPVTSSSQRNKIKTTSRDIDFSSANLNESLETTPEKRYSFDISITVSPEVTETYQRSKTKSAKISFTQIESPEKERSTLSSATPSPASKIPDRKIPASLHKVNFSAMDSDESSETSPQREISGKTTRKVSPRKSALKTKTTETEISAAESPQKTPEKERRYNTSSSRSPAAKSISTSKNKSSVFDLIGMELNDSSESSAETEITPTVKSPRTKKSISPRKVNFSAMDLDDSSKTSPQRETRGKTTRKVSPRKSALKTKTTETEISAAESPQKTPEKERRYNTSSSRSPAAKSISTSKNKSSVFDLIGMELNDSSESSAEIEISPTVKSPSRKKSISPRKVNFSAMDLDESSGTSPQGETSGEKIPKISPRKSARKTKTTESEISASGSPQKTPEKERRYNTSSSRSPAAKSTSTSKNKSSVFDLIGMELNDSSESSAEIEISPTVKSPRTKKSISPRTRKVNFSAMNLDDSSETSLQRETSGKTTREVSPRKSQRKTKTTETEISAAESPQKTPEKERRNNTSSSRSPAAKSKSTSKNKSSVFDLIGMDLNDSSESSAETEISPTVKSPRRIKSISPRKVNFSAMDLDDSSETSEELGEKITTPERSSRTTKTKTSNVDFSIVESSQKTPEKERNSINNPITSPVVKSPLPSQTKSPHKTNFSTMEIVDSSDSSIGKQTSPSVKSPRRKQAKLSKVNFSTMDISSQASAEKSPHRLKQNTVASVASPQSSGKRQSSFGNLTDIDLGSDGSGDNLSLSDISLSSPKPFVRGRKSIKSAVKFSNTLTEKSLNKSKKSVEATSEQEIDNVSIASDLTIESVHLELNQMTTSKKRRTNKDSLKINWDAALDENSDDSPTNIGDKTYSRRTSVLLADMDEFLTESTSTKGNKSPSRKSSRRTQKSVGNKLETSTLQTIPENVTVENSIGILRNDITGERLELTVASQNLSPRYSHISNMTPNKNISKQNSTQSSLQEFSPLPIPHQLNESADPFKTRSKIRHSNVSHTSIPEESIQEMSNESLEAQQEISVSESFQNAFKTRSKLRHSNESTLSSQASTVPSQETSNKSRIETKTNEKSLNGSLDAFKTRAKVRHSNAVGKLNKTNEKQLSKSDHELSPPKRQTRSMREESFKESHLQTQTSSTRESSVSESPSVRNSRSAKERSVSESPSLRNSRSTKESPLQQTRSLRESSIENSPSKSRRNLLEYSVVGSLSRQTSSLRDISVSDNSLKGQTRSMRESYVMESPSRQTRSLREKSLSENSSRSLRSSSVEESPLKRRTDSMKRSLAEAELRETSDIESPTMKKKSRSLKDRVIHFDNISDTSKEESCIDVEDALAVTNKSILSSVSSKASIAAAKKSVSFRIDKSRKASEIMNSSTSTSTASSEHMLIIPHIGVSHTQTILDFDEQELSTALSLLETKTKDKSFSVSDVQNEIQKMHNDSDSPVKKKTYKSKRFTIVDLQDAINHARSPAPSAENTPSAFNKFSIKDFERAIKSLKVKTSYRPSVSLSPRKLSLRNTSAQLPLSLDASRGMVTSSTPSILISPRKMSLRNASVQHTLSLDASRGMMISSTPFTSKFTKENLKHLSIEPILANDTEHTLIVENDASFNVAGTSQLDKTKTNETISINEKLFDRNSSVRSTRSRSSKESNKRSKISLHSDRSISSNSNDKSKQIDESNLDITTDSEYSSQLFADDEASLLKNKMKKKLNILTRNSSKKDSSLEFSGKDLSTTYLQDSRPVSSALETTKKIVERDFLDQISVIPAEPESEEEQQSESEEEQQKSESENDKSTSDPDEREETEEENEKSTIIHEQSSEDENIGGDSSGSSYHSSIENLEALDQQQAYITDKSNTKKVIGDNEIFGGNDSDIDSIETVETAPTSELQLVRKSASTKAVNIAGLITNYFETLGEYKPMEKKKVVEKKNIRKERKAISEARMYRGKPYRKPPLPKRKPWVTNRLYAMLQERFETINRLDAVNMSVDFVNMLVERVTATLKSKSEAAIQKNAKYIAKSLKKYNFVDSHYDYFMFCRDFLPDQFVQKSFSSMSQPDYL